MELRNINTFIVAGETLNFSKTAKLLGYSQAAITIQIKALEEELGVTLFDRIGKNVYLTENGKTFLNKAQQLKIQIDNLNFDFNNSNNSTGTIRIGMSESILSTHFQTNIAKFNQIYPNIQIVVKTGIRDHLFDWMLHNELDFAYIIDRNVIANEWSGEIVKTEKVNFVTNCNHPFQIKKDISIKDILTQNLIMTETNYGYSYELAQLLATNGLELNPFLEVGNTDFICKMLESNNFIGYLPSFIIENNDKLKPIIIPEFEVTIALQFLWHKNKFLTKPMRDLMMMLK